MVGRGAEIEVAAVRPTEHTGVRVASFERNFLCDFSAVAHADHFTSLRAGDPDRAFSIEADAVRVDPRKLGKHSAI